MVSKNFLLSIILLADNHHSPLPDPTSTTMQKSAGNTKEAAELPQKAPVREFLETTSVKGVPKVVKSRNKCLGALWLAALLFGLGVAAFFLTKLFINFFSYGANLQLSEEPVTAADFPDITLCNLNPFANTPFGTNDIDQLFRTVNQAWNPMLQHYYGNPNFDIFRSLPDFKEVLRPGKLLEFLTENLPENGYNETRNFLLFCEWVTDIEDYDCSGNARVQLYTTDYGYCFTFQQPVNATNTTGFSAILYLDSFSFVTHMPAFPVGLGNVFTDGARIVLHPAGSQPLLKEGLNIEAGDHTTVTVKLQRMKRLGPPYSVCEKELPINLCWPGVDIGANTRYRREQCEDYCFQNDILSRCNCITGTRLSAYSMRENTSFCGKKPSDNIVEIFEFISATIECYNSITEVACPADCTEDRYDLTLFRSDWPHPSYQLAFYDEHIRGKPYENDFAAYSNISSSGDVHHAFSQLQNLDLIRRNFLQINVVWQQETLTLMSEKESMGIEALIGNLGGVLNLWVGISFVTAVEILEMFFNCCPCIKKRNKSKVKKVQVQPAVTTDTNIHHSTTIGWLDNYEPIRKS